MKQIVIDCATRREVKAKFKITTDKMTHVLKFELNSIRARKVRSYIMNYKEFHIINEE